MKTIGSVVSGRDVYVLRVDQSVLEASRYMAARKVGAVAVLEGTRLVGILSERDIMARVVAKGLDPGETAVESVMTRDLVVADAEQSCEEGLRRMQQAGCRHLPVVQADRLLGMVSLRDLLQLDVSAKDEAIRWLNAYVHYVPPGVEGAS